MTDKLNLRTTVSYRDVDRTEALLLPAWFKLLQEAAILHANQFDAGTRAIVARGESWVLNRMAVEIERYPRFEEALRIETWSRGVKGFKGYREFRVFDAHEKLILSGSSLWLYIDVEKKSLVRVPANVVASFPVCSEGPFQPEIDRLEFASPSPDANVYPITLRFSDFDANDHVNNTAYFDFLQTGLARAGARAQPSSVRIKFAKGIPAGAESIAIRISRSEAGARFAIEDGATVFATGDAR